MRYKRQQPPITAAPIPVAQPIVIPTTGIIVTKVDDANMLTAPNDTLPKTDIPDATREAEMILNLSQPKSAFLTNLYSKNARQQPPITAAPIPVAQPIDIPTTGITATKVEEAKTLAAPNAKLPTAAAPDATIDATK